MTNWVEIIEENRDEIIEAMMEANKASYLSYLDNFMGDAGYKVSINEDGEISTYWDQCSNIAGDIYDGTAILVGFFPDMTDYDFDYNSIIDYMVEQEKVEFEKWCEENNELFTDSNIKEWNLNIYNRIMEESIEDLIYANSEDILHYIDSEIEKATQYRS